MIVKPKKTQLSVITKNEIQKEINPAEIRVGISQIKEVQNGSISIKYYKEGDMEKLITSINEKLSGNYETFKEELRKPSLKIVGINKEYTKEELERTIQLQNDIGDKQINVKYVKPNRKNSTFTAFVDVTPGIFSRFIRSGKILVGWQRCLCYEDLNLNRCMKCKGYRHKAIKCHNEQACGRCAGEHRDGDCNMRNRSCINCTRANIKYKTEYDTNHSVYDIKTCSAYQHLTRIQKSHINYNF